MHGRTETSDELDVRGLRYHVTRWGDPAAPLLFLLHGRMDCGGSFRYVVEALREGWHVVAPDWRGCGRSEWADAFYLSEDYFADLDVLLSHYGGEQPVRLVGHSMGGNVAGMYAGLRPERIAWLISLEGYGSRAISTADEAYERYHKWLDRLRSAPPPPVYPNFEAIADRLRRRYPLIPAERANEVARLWAVPADGGVVLRSDPRLRIRNPVEYRLPEMMACWRHTTAPVLWVTATESHSTEFARKHPERYAARAACIAHLAERTITRSGHMMHLDRPDAVAEVIEEFAHAVATRNV